MQFLKNRFVQASAAVAVVATLALVTPRAAHALAAALVQVSNTTENPAITQSVPSQASRMVLLSTSLLQNSSSYLYSFGAGSLGLSAYTVPTGQSLVVTGVDITPNEPCATGWSNYILFGNSSEGASMMWTVFAPSTGHYTYPSGIVFAAGSQPQISFSAASTPAGVCPGTQVNLLGYLTYN
jgi:hypothetical protein